MRYIAALLFSLIFGGISLQAQEFSFYQASEPFDRAQLKDVMIAVADLDPAAMVFHSDDMTILQVKMTGAVTEDQLRSAISNSGLQILPGTPDLVSRYGNNTPEVPVYIPTGDAQADHARYVQAVNTWNQTNPNRQLPQPLPYADEQ